jgi:uncharacterized membrane protein YeiH
LEDPVDLAVITAAALVTVVYVRWRPPPEESLAVADAFGLAFFVVRGAYRPRSRRSPGQAPA